MTFYCEYIEEKCGNCRHYTVGKSYCNMMDESVCPDDNCGMFDIELER